MITGTEAAQRCERARIAYGHIRDVGSLEDNPQLQARKRWTETDSPMGPIASLLPPFVMDGTAPAPGAVPSIGEHTEQILNDLGYGDSEISALRQAQVI
jgi:itaconate CoA-transferase